MLKVPDVIIDNDWNALYTEGNLSIGNDVQRMNTYKEELTNSARVGQWFLGLR